MLQVFSGPHQRSKSSDGAEISEENMAQVIVKGIDTSVIERLKARAKQHKTTLQAEVKEILEQASRQDMVTARKVAAQLRRKL